MDPRDVTSSRDVRDGWDEWDSDERLDALGALANSHLADYGYDGTDVYNDGGGGYGGSTDEAGIHLDQDLLDSDNPEDAIHTTNHETVHVMDEEDGIDSGISPSDYPEDYEFSEEETAAILNHMDVGDQARVFDRDGWVDRDAPRSGSGSGAGGGPSGGGFDGSGDGSGSPAPPTDELSVEINWASGVWVDSTAADGSYSVEIFYAPTEGW